MNAADVLKAARAAGVHLGIDGDDLVLERSLGTARRGARRTFPAQGRDRGTAAARPRRMVGRGLAGLL